MSQVLQSAADVLSWIFRNIIFINIVLAVLIVFFQRREPQAVWTWLLVLTCLPIVGFILYIIIGQDFHKRNMFKTKEISDMVSATISQQQTAIRTHAYPDRNEEYSDLVLYNLDSSGAVLTADNQVRILDDGMEKMQCLCEELKKAEHFIHIQYYIIRDDEAFAMLEPILLEKVRDGVEVRVLYDDMGCRATSPKFWKRLQEGGIRVATFFPAYLKRFQMRVNYRNHRKIVVIDNKVGFVGGFNLGREYLGLSQRFGYWQDLHLRISGSAVLDLEKRFILDWSYASKENLVAEHKYTTPDPAVHFSGTTPMQIIISGPDTKYQNIRNNYLRLINRAKGHIWIQSPYFVPDAAILSALRMAILSGVEVNVLIPCKPDHMFIYWVTYSYIGELIEIGANCYTFNDGFLHGKYVSVDGEACCVGTANMDIRSFKLNFEVNAVIYDPAVAVQIEDNFRRVRENATQITQTGYAERGTKVRAKEQLCRLLSPLM